MHAMFLTYVIKYMMKQLVNHWFSVPIPQKSVLMTSAVARAPKTTFQSASGLDMGGLRYFV